MKLGQINQQQMLQPLTKDSKMKLRIDIMLKEGVLDPQGKAISHALGTLGFNNVSDVRVGKSMIIETKETDEAKAIQDAKSMAEKLLANMVIEDFTVTVL